MSSHRDLIAWKVADEVALEVHRYCSRHWTPALSSTLEQVRRASLSVPLNIAEGYASGLGARCRFHLRIAYGSAVETTELLDFIRRLNDKADSEIHHLTAKSRRTNALLFRLWQRSRAK